VVIGQDGIDGDIQVPLLKFAGHGGMVREADVGVGHVVQVDAPDLGRRMPPSRWNARQSPCHD
jgi:hypothetical protein